MYKKYTSNTLVKNFFLILFSLIPLSILIGPAISLINILLIDIIFLFLIIISRDLSFLRDVNFRYILYLFSYLLINTIISIDVELSFSRNLGFVRIILLFLAFNYFFSDSEFFNKVLRIWSIIFFVVIFDIYFEFIIGHNILGYDSEFYEDRIMSFFKDEPVVGSFVNSFFLMLLGFLLTQKTKISKNLILFISLIILISVIITGERSNSIRSIIGFLFFLFFIIQLDFKKKVLFFICTCIFFLIIIFNSAHLKYRFIDQIKNLPIKENIYIKHYISGLEVFKKFPYFGTGNKNYRVETCQLLKKNKKYICQTHPHQVYLEFLSEHGIVGTFIIFLIFYKIIFSKLFDTIRSRNYLQTGCLIYMFLIFIPIIPTGAFFSDFSLTLFSINFSIFYAVNKNLNIYTSIKN